MGGQLETSCHQGAAEANLISRSLHYAADSCYLEGPSCDVRAIVQDAAGGCGVLIMGQLRLQKKMFVSDD